MTSPQPPKTDFLALTHGQEWVTFYESFDKLVQDHLSRSSDLLRRAMSLPEVADREVAQVRDELEGRLNAERDRTTSVLTDLKAQIGNSHRLASTLAMSIGSLMTDLHSLSIRVDEALQSSAAPMPEPSGSPATQAPAQTMSAPSAPVAPSGLLSSSLSSPAAAMSGSSGIESSAAAAPAFGATPARVPATDEESAPEPMASPEMVDLVTVEDLIAPPVDDVADLADAVDAADEAPIDLTAIAEAEASSTDAAVAQTSADTAEGSAQVSEGSTDATKVSDGESSSESSERQRPHWLSVTRVGASRP